MSGTDDVQRYTTNLRGEVEGSALYTALAEAEQDPHLAEVYRRLAAVESAHAEFWHKQLARIGVESNPTNPRHLGARTRALIWLIRRFGPQFVLPTVSALERRDSGQYDTQPEAVAGGLPRAERPHPRVVVGVGPPGAGGPSCPAPPPPPGRPPPPGPAPPPPRPRPDRA